MTFPWSLGSLLRFFPLQDETQKRKVLRLAEFPLSLGEGLAQDKGVLVEGWKFDRPRGRCLRCGGSLPPGHAFMASLYPGARGIEPEFDRRDFCRNCWSERAEDPYAFWSAKMPQPDRPRRLPQQALWEGFRELASLAEPDSDQRKFLFLVALELTRRRILKLLETQTRRGGTWVSFEKRPEGQRFEIVQPPISDGELVTLSERVLEQFGAQRQSEDSALEPDA